MVQRVSARHLVLVISLASILTSFLVIALGCLLITRSRLVSGNIGLKIYQIYGDSILGLANNSSHYSHGASILTVLL